jgi:hypothetical protein
MAKHQQQHQLRRVGMLKQVPLMVKREQGGQLMRICSRSSTLQMSQSLWPERRRWRLRQGRRMTQLLQSPRCLHHPQLHHHQRQARLQQCMLVSKTAFVFWISLGRCCWFIVLLVVGMLLTCSDPGGESWCSYYAGSKLLMLV